MALSEPAVRTSASKISLGSWLIRTFGVLPLLIMLAVVVFQCGNPRFLSHANLMNVLQQSVYLALTALAQMLVLISGGFDLSVGANIALTSIVSASAMVAFEGAYPSLGLAAVLVGTAATVGVGLFVGFCNALGVALLRVNPFVVTLATASIFQGLTLIVSQGLQVPDLPDAFVLGIGSSSILGLPVSVALTIPIAIAAYVLTGWTRYGRYLYAVGSNPRAANVAGVSIQRTLIATYVLAALISSFAGFLLTARVSSGEPLLGAEFPLRSITAAVIGGCSLRGGQGTVIGTILGVAFVTIIANGMDLLRFGSNYQMIFIGFVLVGAVLLDGYRSSMSRRR